MNLMDMQYYNTQQEYEYTFTYVPWDGKELSWEFNMRAVGEPEGQDEESNNETCV